jgi:hypothetical protein
MDKDTTISVEIDGSWYEIPNYRPETLGLTKALELFEDSIPDIKEACQLNVLHIMRENPKIIPTGSDDLDWIHEGLRELRIKRGVEGYQKTLKRIKSREDARRNPHRTSITDDMIQAAREYPISDMYDGHLRGGEDRRRFGICPFHAESTGSFCIHPDNRWSCFGACNEHSDSIGFKMKLDGIDFIQAVKALQ